MVIRNIFLLAFAGCTMLLSGCAVTSEGKSVGLGNLNGLGNEPMSMVVVHKNPDYDNGRLTESQYKTVVAHANSCLIDTHRQMAPVQEVQMVNGGVDAATGFVGGWGDVATQGAVRGIPVSPQVGASVGAGTAVLAGVQGYGNGAKIKSSVVASYVGNCTNGDLHDSLTAAGMAGVHVYSSGVRTKNTSDHLPSYVKRVPGYVQTLGQPSQPAAADTPPDPQNSPN